MTAADAWRRVPLPVVWVIVTALVAASPWLGLPATWVRLLILIAILSLTVSGLNLSWGYAGELALGQAAFYAAGAYTAAYLATNVINDVLVGIVAAGAVALVLGLVTGVPGLRLGGWTLAMISFFLVVLIPAVVNIFGTALGGFSGFIGIPLPALFGQELGPEAYFVVVTVATSVWFAAFRNIAVGRVGAGLLVLKSSPDLAGSLGIRPFGSKLMAYAVGAVPAGIAGALFASLDGFLAPESFSLDLAIAILAASILGGSRSVYGVFVGAAIMQLGPLRASAFQQFALPAYGVFLVVGGVVLAEGITGWGRRVLRYLYSRGRSVAPVPGRAATVQIAPIAPIDGLPLRIEGIGKSFGGNAALVDVTVRAEPGQVTALIGPNGSGKTTLLNLVGGYYSADTGTITLGDTPLTNLAPYRVSRAGVGRTFQTPIVPAAMDVLTTVMCGRYGTDRTGVLGAVLRTPAYRRAVRADRERAEEVLRSFGMGEMLHQDAASLSLGTRRMVELARLLVGQRTLVLLDEVASGLDEEEIDSLVGVITAVREAGATVVLVEHNFTLVKLLADRVVVLADGRVLAEGVPADIEAHPEVLERYLGAGAGISGTRTATATAAGDPA